MIRTDASRYGDREETEDQSRVNDKFVNDAPETRRHIDLASDIFPTASHMVRDRQKR